MFSLFKGIIKYSKIHLFEDDSKLMFYLFSLFFFFLGGAHPAGAKSRGQYIS